VKIFQLNENPFCAIKRNKSATGEYRPNEKPFRFSGHKLAVIIIKTVSIREDQDGSGAKDVYHCRGVTGYIIVGDLPVEGPGGKKRGKENGGPAP
jgi:hypothetical protein